MATPVSSKFRLGLERLRLRWRMSVSSNVRSDFRFSEPSLPPKNLFAGGVVSGASTLDMQLCRMLDPRPRTLESKLSEASRAWQADVFLSKDGFLRLSPRSLGVTFRARRPRHYGILVSPQKNFPCPRLPCWPGIPQSPARFVRIDIPKPALA